MLLLLLFIEHVFLGCWCCCVPAAWDARGQVDPEEDSGAGKKMTQDRRPPSTNMLLKTWVAHGLPAWQILWVLCFNSVSIRNFIFWWNLVIKTQECFLERKEQLLNKKIFPEKEPNQSPWKECAENHRSIGKNIDTIPIPINSEGSNY